MKRSISQSDNECEGEDSTAVQRHWKSRVLYRVGEEKGFEWRVLGIPIPADGANAEAARLKSIGIEVLVCPSDEFDEKGLPGSFDAREYF
jgi:hypothetical protein